MTAMCAAIFDWDRYFIPAMLASGITLWFAPSRSLGLIVRHGNLYQLQQQGLPLPTLLFALVLPGNLRVSQEKARPPSRLALLVAQKAIAVYALVFVVLPHIQDVDSFVFTLYGGFLLYSMAALIFDAAAVFGAVAFGLHYHQSFDRPFLAASLGEFWSRRWNLMVSTLLRQSCYEPIRLEAKRRGFSRSPTGQQIVNVAGAMACFIASAVMHECLLCLILNRLTLQWFIFFSLQGLLTCAERLIGNSFPKAFAPVPRPVKQVLTLLLLSVTGRKYFVRPAAGEPFERCIRELRICGAWVQPSLVSFKRFWLQ